MVVAEAGAACLYICEQGDHTELSGLSRRVAVVAFCIALYLLQILIKVIMEIAVDLQSRTKTTFTSWRPAIL